MDIFFSLTVNGLAMGMMIFLLASGLTLIFGLMSVLNFSHGVLFMLGAYSGVWIYLLTGNFILALLLAPLVGAIIGLLVEKLTISKAYGNHMAQILLTIGVMMVLQELIIAVWGPNIIAVPVPPLLAGSWEIGGVILTRYRLFTIVAGGAVALLVHLVLTRTRLGMIVRAGVENSEMVQALGINIRRVFSLVFAGGAALAAFGGVIMAPLVGAIGPSIGIENQMTAFIVVVIGGIGSFAGSLLGAIMVGLAAAYTAWVWPGASMAVNVGLMAIILMVRPTGLFGMGGGR